ncbi:MAG: PIN domain-containing protein [Peptococcaceae bacterium]|nr:PIN domain-containing protein [Peptococcaceae bacterium]
MGISTFNKEILKCSKVLLDTSAIIYFLNDTPPYQDVLKQLFTLIEDGAIEAVISLITEIELLVGPMKRENEQQLEGVKLFLNEFPNLTVASVSRDIGFQAARIRATTGLKLPDALIIATGIVYNCDTCIGNDLSWKKCKKLSFICLDDLV